jgi:hypothetical protein
MKGTPYVGKRYSKKRRAFGCSGKKLSRADDNYHSTSAHFRGLNLNEIHGNSGLTRGLILEQRKEAFKRWKVALQWVETLPYVEP